MFLCFEEITLNVDFSSQISYFLSSQGDRKNDLKVKQYALFKIDVVAFQVKGQYWLSVSSSSPPKSYEVIYIKGSLTPPPSPPQHFRRFPNISPVNFDSDNVE